MFLRLLLAVSLLCWRAQAFSWDETTVERLFANSEEVFENLRVDPEDQECVSQYRSFVEDLKRDRKWARRVLDAWAKEPAGLESGVVVDMGHYDQCVQDDELFPKQQCSLRMESARNYSYKASLCLPAACSKAMTLQISGVFFRNVDVSISEVYECSDGRTPAWGALKWTASGVSLALLLLCLGGTFMELRGSDGLLVAFSLYRNTSRLFETRENFGPMACLNGIKTLSMVWIVLLHAYSAYVWRWHDLLNPLAFEEFHLTISRSVIFAGMYAVDSFFVIGGTLLAFNFMRDRERGQKFNTLRYILHRYLRLMPNFLFIVLLVVAFGLDFRGAPRQVDFVSYLAVDNCKKYWWSVLLMVQNYVNPNELCIEQSWYLSSDFQLYLLSPFLLFPLAKYGRKFFPVIALVCIAPIFFIFPYILVKSLHFRHFLLDYWWAYLYYPSYVRVFPWVAGMALGYFLFQTQSRKVNISKILQTLFWVLSVAVVAGCFYIPYYNYKNFTENVLLYAFYESLQRPLWSLVVIWTIYACIKGLAPPLNWLLSFSFFQPLSKLSYATYLIHPPFLFLLTASQRTLVHFSPYLLAHFFFGVLLFSILLSLPLVLMVEVPFGTVESRIWKRKNVTT